jgi:hypothetical protein
MASTYDDYARALLATHETMPDGTRRERTHTDLVIDVAEALREAVLAERERCAAHVRWLVRWAGAACEEAQRERKEHDCDRPQYLEGRGDALDEAWAHASRVHARIAEGEP